MRYSVVIEVASFPVRGDILTQECIGTLNGRDGSYDFDLNIIKSASGPSARMLNGYLFVTDVFSGEGNRPLHRDNA